MNAILRMSKATGRKDYKGHEVTFEGDKYICYQYLWLHALIDCGGMSKLVKLYALNMCSLFYVAYTSINVSKHDCDISPFKWILR